MGAIKSSPLLANLLKLVIWDLDETFWRGTLSEEDVELVPGNVEIVKELCRRGIISSICSKNDFEDAKSILARHGLWEYFVFPKIAFEAKGRAIAAMIEEAGLRPENVLFVDDNPLNLAEAAHFAPGLMIALPEKLLPALLGLSQAQGKNDTEMSRLRQYKNMERKVADRAASNIDNTSFLRSCAIKVSIELNIESDIDRVFELINRSNQMNYTKRRLECAKSREDFRNSLNRFGVHAGIVRAKDRYGDYGIVGFFFLNNEAGERRLEHFVFSCRTMNMGLEQFVFDRLNRPSIDVVEPVSNPVVSFDKVDWIELVDSVGIGSTGSEDPKLLLLGGCDLLQVSNFCSSNREEFVNHIREGIVVRYDDPGFILTSRPAASQSMALTMRPAWSFEDAERFDDALSEAKVIVVSMWDALFGQYLRTDDGVVIRADEGWGGLGEHLLKYPNDILSRNSTFFELSPKQKMALILASLDRIAAQSPDASHRFFIGRNTVGRKWSNDLRHIYNYMVVEYCRKTGHFEYIDVDKVLSVSDVIDGNHFTRIGYHKIAARIGALMKAPSTLPQAPAYDPSSSDKLRKVLGRAICRKGAPVGRLPRLLLRLPAKLSRGRVSL